MRTGALGSCDAEFHSGCLLRVGASARAVPRPPRAAAPARRCPHPAPSSSSASVCWKHWAMILRLQPRVV
ncbi:hypothetical protein VULLAG_LOCUS10086 [Vulpes lagopus]